MMSSQSSPSALWGRWVHSLVCSKLVALALPLLWCTNAPAQVVTPVGPSSEALSAVHVSPHDPDLVIGQPDPSGRNGLLRSIDGGVSFEAVLPSATVVYDVCFHPTEPDTVWAMGTWLYTSGDGGLTWSQTQRPGSAHTGQRLLYAPASHTLYWASGQNGYVHEISLLHASTDGGATWEQRWGAPVMELRLDDLHLRTDTADTLFSVQTLPPSANGARSVVRSTDGGETWDYLAFPGPVTHYVLTGHLRIHPTNPDLMLATAEVYAGEFAVVSIDGGSTFHLLGGPWGGPEHLHPEIQSTGLIHVFSPDSAWQSDDLGVSWTSHYGPAVTYPPRDWDGIDADQLRPHPTDPDRLFLPVGESYLYTADSGASWTLGADGMEPLAVYSVQASPADDERWIAATQDGLFLSRDAGASWQFMLLEFQPQARFHPTDPDRIVRWGFLGVPDLTLNGGQSWTTLDMLGNVTGFAFHPTDPDHMVCVANPPGTPPGGYYTDDGGASWQQAANAAAYGGFLYTEPLNPDRVLLLKLVGPLLQLNESLDGGQTYTTQDVDGNFQSLSFAPDDASMVMVDALLGGEFVGRWTADRTEPFSETIPLPGGGDTDLELAPDGWMVTASETTDRVYVSADRGQHWTLRYDGSSEDNPVNGGVLAVLSTGSMLMAAGEEGLLLIEDGLGVEDGPATATGTDLPLAVELLPVYPNPFNGSATVTVQVHQPGRYGLTVSDLLGRTVWTVPSSRWQPGLRTVALDGSAWPSGAYWLRVDGAAAVRRVTLVK